MCEKLRAKRDCCCCLKLQNNSGSRHCENQIFLFCLGLLTNCKSVPAMTVLSGLLILMFFCMSQASVCPSGTDWLELVLLWVVIVMPTGSGKCFKCLKSMLEVRNRIDEDSDVQYCMVEASLERMDWLMLENNWKLLEVFDKLTHFLTQLNIYRNRGLMDNHDLLMLLQ